MQHTMQKISIALAAFAVAAVTASPVRAADATVGADVNSAYVWRGLTFNDEGVVQPSLDVAHESGLGFNVWGNLDIGDYDNAVESGEFSEVDLTASYALPIEEVDVSVGYIEYLYPAIAEDAGLLGTREVTASVGKSIEDFSLGLTGYYDFDEVEDYYANASVGYTIAVGEQLSIDLGAAIGYAGDDFAAFYAGGTDDGFFDWNTSLTGTYALSETLELGGFIAYTENVDDDVLPDDSVDVDVYGGGSVYWSF